LTTAEREITGKHWRKETLSYGRNEQTTTKMKRNAQRT
jgi:hypothetical protein